MYQSDGKGEHEDFYRRVEKGSGKGILTNRNQTHKWVTHNHMHRHKVNAWWCKVNKYEGAN